jgi:hypothetical protein
MTSENRKKRKTVTFEDSAPLTAADRFKEWLKVQPGAHVEAIDFSVRQQYPKATEAELSQLISAEVRNQDRRRKSAHERFMSNDKACRLLLNAYLGGNDTTAFEIYMLYQTEYIRRKHVSNRKAAEDEIKRVSNSVGICKGQIEKKRVDLQAGIDVLIDKYVAWEKEELPLEDVHESLMLSQTLVNNSSDEIDLLESTIGMDGRVTVGAPAGAADLRSAAEFVSAYSADMSQSAENTQRRHIASMTQSLASAINLTAALVEVAPKNAVFGDLDEDSAPSHPVEAMQKILQKALPVEPERVSNYIKQWQRTQNESQEDTDRAIAAMHNVQERDVIVRDMVKRGLSEEEAQAAMSHSIDPANSPFMGVISQFISDQEFQEASKQVMSEIGQSSSARMPSLAEKQMETAKHIETVNRAYLAKYMREPLGEQYGERPCASSFNCVCMTMSSSFPMVGTNIGGFVARDVAGNGSTIIGEMIDADMNAKDSAAQQSRSRLGFVCREFLLPSQEAYFRKNHKLPKQHQLCILCNRRETTFQYMQVMGQRGPGEPLMPTHVFQDHAVIVDQEGEYDKSACLKTQFDKHQFTGIVLPFVGFSASHYSYATVVEHSQTLAAVVEKAALDFRHASASATRI